MRIGGTLDLSNVHRSAYANGGIIKVRIDGRQAVATANRMSICHYVYGGDGSPHWCTKENDVTKLGTVKLQPVAQ